MSRAPIALTCGDPAGVGLELSALAWRALHSEQPFFLIADRGHVAERVQDRPVVEIDRPEDTEAAFAQGLPILHHSFPEPAIAGQLSPANAAATISAIDRGVAFVMHGAASALCTNPIHKQNLKTGAGFAFPGHTEYLAHLAGGVMPVMMLAAPALRVVPVTIHIALSAVARHLTPDLLAQTIRITHRDLQQRFGIANPRIAVAGLNPHAGEGGSMGREELDIIIPVLEALRHEGLTLSGPHSADTMFHPEAREGYDVAVCMYHDQALIPLKTLDFHGGTNITLGLPFVRTSPDHGTALDLAGTGRANPSSLIAALREAARMSQA